MMKHVILSLCKALYHTVAWKFHVFTIFMLFHDNDMKQGRQKSSFHDLRPNWLVSYWAPATSSWLKIWIHHCQDFFEFMYKLMYFVKTSSHNKHALDFTPSQLDQIAPISHSTLLIPCLIGFDLILWNNVKFKKRANDHETIMQFCNNKYQ